MLVVKVCEEGPTCHCKKALQVPLPQPTYPHFWANPTGRRGGCSLEVWQGHRGAGRETESPGRRRVGALAAAIGPLITYGRAEGGAAKIPRDF